MRHMPVWQSHLRVISEARENNAMCERCEPGLAYSNMEHTRKESNVYQEARLQ